MRLPGIAPPLAGVASVRRLCRAPAHVQPSQLALTCAWVCTPAVCGRWIFQKA
jgi:hypothetical protein